MKVGCVGAEASRPFGELLGKCEIRAIVCRVVSAVWDFFKVVAHGIATCCSGLKDRVVDCFGKADSEMEMGENWKGVLDGCSKKERREVIRNAKLVIDNSIDAYGRGMIVSTLLEVAVKERGEVIEKSIPFITAEMDAFSRQDIIRGVAGVAQVKREDVLRLAKKVIAPKMCGKVTREIIRAIDLMKDDGEDVIKNAMPLIQKESHPYGKLNLIRGVATIPTGEREQLLPVAAPLLLQPMSTEKTEKMFAAIVAIPNHQRIESVMKALFLLDQDIEVEDQIKAMAVK